MHAEAVSDEVEGSPIMSAGAEDDKGGEDWGRA
jgi:hypothetical protein